MADSSSPPSSGAPLAAAWSREAAEGLVARWCDALLARQIAGTGDPMLDGAIACPACGVLHGRVGDLADPFVHRWNRTGEAKCLAAAERVVEWTEAAMRREDGGLYNDFQSQWRAITVFAQIALGKTLLRFGDRPPFGPCHFCGACPEVDRPWRGPDPATAGE